MLLYQKQRVTWDYEKVHLPKITPHLTFQLWSIIWGRGCWKGISGWRAGAKIKGTQKQNLWKGNLLRLHTGAVWAPCGGGKNRHNRKLGRLKGLKTHISYFLFFPRESGQDQETRMDHSTSLQLFSRSNENIIDLGKTPSQIPLTINQNNLKITGVHTQRQWRHLGVQFRSS